MVFDRWSIHKNTRFHRKAYRAIILLACSRGLSLSKIYPILWHTQLPLHAFALHHWRTIVGLHDFVKVSISTSLKSFLLIMCIDAPESTTNSLSSGFKDDARWLLFSGDEKNAAFSCSFNLNTFLASFHAASRAPNSCHSVSSSERSSNFGALGLRSWGSPGQM